MIKCKQLAFGSAFTSSFKLQRVMAMTPCASVLTMSGENYYPGFQEEENIRGVFEVKDKITVLGTFPSVQRLAFNGLGGTGSGCMI